MRAVLIFWLAEKKISCRKKKVAQSSILVSSSMYYLWLLFALDLVLWMFSRSSPIIMIAATNGAFGGSFQSQFTAMFLYVCVSQQGKASTCRWAGLDKRRREREGGVPEAEPLLSWACPCTPRGVLPPHQPAGLVLAVQLSELGPKWQIKQELMPSPQKGVCYACNNF